MSIQSKTSLTIQKNICLNARVKYSQFFFLTLRMLKLVVEDDKSFMEKQHVNKNSMPSACQA